MATATTAGGPSARTRCREQRSAVIGGPAASAKFAPDQALSAAYHHATSHRALIFLPRVVLMGDVAWLSLPTPEFWPALEVGFLDLTADACFWLLVPTARIRSAPSLLPDLATLSASLLITPVFNLFNLFSDPIAASAFQIGTVSD